MTQAQMDDHLKQKYLFTRDIGMTDAPLRQAYWFKVVGYVADHRREADDVQALLDDAKRDFPGRICSRESSMADNLGPPSGKAADRRRHQLGRAEGSGLGL